MRWFTASLLSRRRPHGALALSLLLLAPIRALGGEEGAQLPGTWAEDFARAEIEYSEQIPRWRAAFGDERGALADGYYQRLRTTAELQVLENRQQAIKERLEQVSQELARLAERKGERDSVVTTLDEAVGAANKAVNAEVDEIYRALGTTRLSRAAREALDAWATTHRFMAWELYFMGGPDPRTARWSQLESVMGNVERAIWEQTQELYRLAAVEEQARQRRWAYEREVPAIDLEPLTKERDRLVDAVTEPVQRIRELEERLDGSAGTPLAPEEIALLSASEELYKAYLALESRLEGPTAEEEASGVRSEVEGMRVGRDTWCRLFVHAGVAGLLSQQDGAYEHLQTAVATFGGPCEEHVAELLDLAVVQSAWMSALYVGTQKEPAYLLLDEEGGRWAIDGALLEGPGPTRFRVQPGLHRVELITPQGTDTLVEVVRAGDLLGLRQQEGRIQLDVLLPTDEAWEIPVKRQVFIVADEPPYEPPPRWRVGAGLAAARFDGRPHLGGSLEASWSFSRRASMTWDFGLAFDLLAGAESYAYGVVSTPALIRVRAPVGLLLSQGRIRPMVSLAPGLIPPAQSVTVDLGVGLDWAISGDYALRAALGVGGSIWRSDLTWMEPWTSLTLARRF